MTAYRKMLISKEGQKKRFAEVDEFGRPVLKETHQIAEAMKEKNNKLKDAFGISKHFIEGSSFDINRKEMEEAAREDEKKKKPGFWLIFPAVLNLVRVFSNKQ